MNRWHAPTKHNSTLEASAPGVCQATGGSTRKRVRMTGPPPPDPPHPIKAEGDVHVKGGPTARRTAR
eukprot:10475152-Alexandrium_andersonii.AAC.1